MEEEGFRRNHLPKLTHEKNICHRAIVAFVKGGTKDCVNDKDETVLLRFFEVLFVLFDKVVDGFAKLLQ